ncbi:hypothetical protein [Caballeronia sordidicola]|uniref:hypothetical protein n=1 Tax=Caballeronia sordidicola TaxID=196367 RepID=UPI0004D0140A|nr:hypothetical protein [Caballeronia sordidicola]
MTRRRWREVDDRNVRAEEDRKRQLKLFDDLQADIDKRDFATSDNFDKAIMTYASGGLGFSLVLYKDVMPHSMSGIPVALQISWVFFTLAILAIVLSYLITPKLLDDQLELGERWLLCCDKSANRPSKWEPAVTYTAYAAGGFFVAAVALTVYVAMSGSLHFPVASATPGTSCAAPTIQHTVSSPHRPAAAVADSTPPVPQRVNR